MQFPKTVRTQVLDHGVNPVNSSTSAN